MNEILRNNIKSLNLNGVMVEITCKSQGALTLVKETIKANEATLGVYKGSKIIPDQTLVRYTYKDVTAAEAAFNKLQSIINRPAPTSSEGPISSSVGGTPAPSVTAPISATVGGTTTPSATGPISATVSATVSAPATESITISAKETSTPVVRETVSETTEETVVPTADNKVQDPIIGSVAPVNTIKKAVGNKRTVIIMAAVLAVLFGVILITKKNKK